MIGKLGVANLVDFTDSGIQREGEVFGTTDEEVLAVDVTVLIVTELSVDVIVVVKVVQGGVSSSVATFSVSVEMEELDGTASPIAELCSFVGIDNTMTAKNANPPKMDAENILGVYWLLIATKSLKAFETMTDGNKSRKKDEKDTNGNVISIPLEILPDVDFE